VIIEVSDFQLVQKSEDELITQFWRCKDAVEEAQKALSNACLYATSGSPLELELSRIACALAALEFEAR